MIDTSLCLIDKINICVRTVFCEIKSYRSDLISLRKILAMGITALSIIFQSEEYNRIENRKSARKEEHLRETDQVPTFKPQKLATSLGQQRGFKAPLANFPSEWEREILKLPHIFYIKGDLVKLRPKIMICQAHLSPSGCLERSSCNEFHICSEFIFDSCEKISCDMGHNWRTNHNTRVSKSFYLQHLTDMQVNILMKKSAGSKHVVYSNPPLQQLPDNVSRPYKHNSTHGNPTNHPHAKVDEKMGHKQDVGDMPKKNSPYSGAGIRNTNIHRTVSSHDSQGNPEIREICYKSVSRACHDTVCPRLHSEIHFHWQVTADFKTWFNFPQNIVLFLEDQFCDPEYDFLVLPQLGDSCSNRDLLHLLKNKRWEIAFKYTEWFDNHPLIPLQYQHNKLHIRRLCTEKCPSQKIRANTFTWYYKSDLEEWVSYDVYNIKQLEHAYQSNPKEVVTIHAASFEYKVFFTSMTQVNVKTKGTRRIRRRPLSVAKQRQRGNKK